MDSVFEDWLIQLFFKDQEVHLKLVTDYERVDNWDEFLVSKLLLLRATMVTFKTASSLKNSEQSW